MRLWILSLIVLAAGIPLAASEQHGQVVYGGLPLPGATVTASQGEKKLVTITDAQGAYTLDLPDGTWTIQVDMQCFAPLKRDVTVAAGSTANEQWELKLLPMEEIRAAATLVIAPPPAPAANLTINAPPTDGKQEKPEAKKEDAPKPPTEPNADPSQDASDNFLINGSQNNAAASPFSQSAAFGNNRRNMRGLYNGMFGMILDNSALDAQNFSLTGQSTPKPGYNHIQGVATLGGPLRIPHLITNGPFFFIGYQWTRNTNSTTQTGLMPTAAQRQGDLSALPVPIIDPLNGAPFPGNMIPGMRLSQQALSLLKLYPQPNFTGSSRYNYQIPTTGATHQDALQLRMNKLVNNKNQLSGVFAFQDSRQDSPNLFNFLDTTDTFGLNTNISWRNTLHPRLFGTLTLQFSRMSITTKPFFENRQNVSADAKISGNNQDPANWGPPSLTFADGIASLSDANPLANHAQTSAIGYSLYWSKGRHNITSGTDLKFQQFNYISQQNPRGSLAFTGAASGEAFADFLLGLPETSSIAYGNADKYFRDRLYDAYVTDDWRLSPEITLNLGARWEYNAPMTELYGRLVNLDVAPGFTAVAPVAANDPVGPITGQHYPDSLVHPDKHAVQPRIALAWRPLSGSSLVVRSGYGVYYNTSVYQTIATQMAQQPRQPPLPDSKTFSVQNSAQYPLTLASPFPDISTNTFAVDPNFRVGYAQSWNLSVQRDLPGGLVMIAGYLGTKGTRAVQEFLPNTYPIGAVNPCPACPAGFTYMTSNGNSTLNSGQFQLRRRLHAGFTANLQYTYSKSIDDAALGGTGSASSGGQTAAVIAQNWLDLSAERGLSSFDQRHLLKLQLQYTSGMGLHGGTLLNGWRGTLLKEWTLLSQITAGSGLRLTPVYLAAVQGTGVTGPIRPNYTGANLYNAPSGFSLNPAAYTAPLPGQWGDAGRDSITGPNQFSINASLARTFRLNDRFNLDLRVDATNALNHVTFTAWNTTVNSAQFGLPVSANAMRTMQTTLRVRF
jgi:hypothetical protein